MKTYTNFAFIDGDSIVVLERLAEPSEQVFGPLADAIFDAGVGRPSTEIASAALRLMLTEGEWSLADTIRRNDRKVLVIDIRNDKVTLYNAVECNVTDAIFSQTITEFVNKYGEPVMVIAGIATIVFFVLTIVAVGIGFFVGAANDDEDAFILGFIVAWIFAALGSISLLTFAILAVMQALN